MCSKYIYIYQLFRNDLTNRPNLVVIAVLVEPSTITAINRGTVFFPPAVRVTLTPTRVVKFLQGRDPVVTTFPTNIRPSEPKVFRVFYMRNFKKYE